MNVLNISGFWYLLLLIPVVLLYLLKLRREDHPISSTFLWQSLVRDHQANAPWQRLQRNLLMILQLLFLLALVLAIVRPFIWQEGISSSALILIFDTSFSMSASDEQPNRMGEAKRRALEMLDSLPDETLLTVISAGERPRTLVSLSRDESLVRQTINQLQPSSGSANLAPALQIAAAISERQPDPQTIVFADSWETLPEQFSLNGVSRFEQVGKNDSNQALQTIAYEFQSDGQTLNAFLQLANFGSNPVSRRLLLYADGTPMHAADINIPAHSESTLVVEGIISSTQVLEARLQPSAVGQDFLPLDDAAYAVVRRPGAQKVSIIGSGSRFLETAIRLMPGVEVETLDPTQIPDPDSDLVIYYQTLPDASTYPDANLLFISPLKSTPFFSVTGQIDLPIPQFSEPLDPLAEGLDLSGVSILDAVLVLTPDWAKPIILDGAASDPVPALLFAGELDGRRVAVLTFSLNRSDLPLNVAFPILISRLVHWLVPGPSGMIPVEFRPGEPLQLSGLLQGSPVRPKSLNIIHPDGSKTLIDPNQERPLFTDTNRPGIYQVEIDGRSEISFAVNLSAALESDITPASPPAAVQPVLAGHSELIQMTRNEFWRWAASLALLLLTIEWFIYQRAALLKIMAQLSRQLRSPGLKSK